MKVKQILQSKGASVFAVAEGDGITEAIGVLREKNIGAVVVKDAGGTAIGILSERDVVRRLAADGAATLNLRVGDLMTPKPYTCSPEASLDDVLSQMTEKRIRHLPVTVDGKLVGVVSIGDVVKRKIEQAVREAEALKDYIAS